ncbi:uncharacterized protein C8Q71DRAFT_736592 [Rhodofomes roseus]|uniref:Transmembrane protein n=1 Tax=Rhodofomes roseus TaxID=34475 RepID=A0ABQ8KTN4_9APHY|nr:uncharacterized protein C8Q71DRAFT_736592 [Rhodofomes roseus]KAH9841363.1 hypothetical protein C8Q71DRAFT_736592 [Rhodofomes roseus]
MILVRDMLCCRRILLGRRRCSQDTTCRYNVREGSVNTVRTCTVSTVQAQNCSTPIKHQRKFLGEWARMMTDIRVLYETIRYTAQSGLHTSAVDDTNFDQPVPSVYKQVYASHLRQSALPSRLTRRRAALVGKSHALVPACSRRLMMFPRRSNSSPRSLQYLFEGDMRYSIVSIAIVVFAAIQTALTASTPPGTGSIDELASAMGSLGVEENVPEIIVSPPATKKSRGPHHGSWRRRQQASWRRRADEQDDEEAPQPDDETTTRREFQDAIRRRGVEELYTRSDALLKGLE